MTDTAKQQTIKDFLGIETDPPSNIQNLCTYFFELGIKTQPEKQTLRGQPVQEIIIPLTPMGKPRMTRNSHWKKGNTPVKRYWKWKDDLMLLTNKEGYELEDKISIDFYLPMAKSWTKKRKAEMMGKPHQFKPDVDNMLKAFMDALASKDEHVYDARGRKFWSDRGYMVIKKFA